MARVGGMVCAAGVICLVLAGCDSLRDFNLTAAALLAAGGNDRVVAGSLDEVSGSTQAALQQLGLFVSSTREGDAIRLRATTRTGQHFSLVLTRKTSEGRELTNLRFEWENGRDEDMEMQILSQVETPRKG
jgi:hypothetical protein